MHCISHQTTSDHLVLHFLLKVNIESSCSAWSRRDCALACTFTEPGISWSCLQHNSSAGMTSFLKSKLKGSTKSTPPVSNQSSFSETNDDDFHDASEEVIYATRMASCGFQLRVNESVGLGLKGIFSLAQLCGCSCRSLFVCCQSQTAVVRRRA